MSTPTTCTYGPSAVTGDRCGQPALATFVASDGEVYAECVEHLAQIDRDAVEVGDTITVRRHGCEYEGIVERISASGRVFAKVTYKNGVTRVVEVN